MPSKFGDFQVGAYNVLPKDTKTTAYTAPDTITLTRCPSLLTDPLRAAMDLGIVKSEAEAALPLDDAYDWFEKNLDGFKRGDAWVNGSWMDWLTGTPSLSRQLGDPLGAFGRAEMVEAVQKANWKLAVTGRLVGVAPLVCSGSLIEGPAKQKHTESASVSVTDTTTEKIEAGLGVSAGIEYEGVGVQITGSLTWSLETSHSTTVTKTFGDELEFDIDKGEWGRVDIRVCAGLYTGWLGVQNYKRSFDLYPFRGPVHVPGFASAVAVHQMRAADSEFGPAEKALVSEFSRVTRERKALAAQAGLDGDGLAQLAVYGLEQRRLADALRALGL
ncbi:hypothetical protein [Streptomyces griseoviridis]|uniref:hypothetical protein n=1 Tax=Streptomyces griseoviridis TaxID=45398 RepID=UPI00345722A9